MDFEDWRMSSADEYGVRGVDREAYREAVSKLHVLSFHIDRKGENIVSEIDGVIAFIDRNYYGETVSPGDVWLCSAVLWNTVYYVKPLKKITSSMIMGLSDEIREGVIASLWKTNRREFEKIFEERYKEEIYARATEEANRKNEEIIHSLQDRISDLNRQVEHSRMVISMRESDADDEIVLTSDPVVRGESSPDQGVLPAIPVHEERPPSPWVRTETAPGLPEMRFQDVSPAVRQFKCTVERVGEETLKCDAFEDGKYFVHINPGKTFLVVRKHDYGQVICVNRSIRVEGLGSYSPFSGRKSVMAEYNQRYGGLLIHL